MSLTVRAAARGVIDFRQARLRDVNWWRRTNILLAEVARDDDAAATHASYLFHLALVANGSLEEDGFKAEQKKARETFNEYVACTHPWAERVRRQRQLDDAKALADLYKQVCGDPDDPLTRERWRQASAALEARISTPDPAAATMAAVAAALAAGRAPARPTPVALD